MIETWGIGLDAARKRAKKIYSKIGRIPCPFFSGEMVAFNSRGFTHLLRSGSHRRPVSQRLIRLSLVEHVEAIVKNDNGDVTVEFRQYEIDRVVNRSGVKILEKNPAKSWGFKTKIAGSEVKLVIVQVEGKQKEFFSIMADKFVLHENDKTKNPT